MVVFTQVVHSLLLREITVDGARENELLVSIGGKKARFGQKEFCLVTGLRFGQLSDIVNTPYVGNANGIQERYLAWSRSPRIEIVHSV